MASLVHFCPQSLLLVLVAYVSLVCVSSTQALPIRRVCYMWWWLVHYPPPRYHEVNDVNASLCTHLVSFGAMAIRNGRVFEALRNEPETAQFDQLQAFRKRHKSTVKMIVGLGGEYYDWKADLKPMLKTQQSRSTFIDSVIPYMNKWHFDGIHLNFPFPNVTSRADKDGFVSFLRELRKRFKAESDRTGKPLWEMSGSVSCRKAVIERAYDVQALNENLEWITLLAYDFDFDNKGLTAHQAPLRLDFRKADESPGHSVEWAVKYWKSAGIPPSKMVLGISFYASTFLLRDNRDIGFSLPQVGRTSYEKWDWGNYTRKEGRCNYYEVCWYLSHGAQAQWNSWTHTPYAIYGGWLWIGYENPRSVSDKLSYIRTSRLSGWMAFHIADDDFRGTFCHEGKYPLLNALNGHYQLKIRSLRYHRFLATVLFAIAALLLTTKS